MKYMNYVVVN